MPANGIGGQRVAVLVQPDARVKRVRVGLFCFPEELIVRGHAVQVGLTARKTVRAFQYDESEHRLNGLFDFRVPRLDLHS